MIPRQNRDGTAQPWWRRRARRREALARERVAREALLLPVVHHDDLVPILGDLGQAEGAAEVDEVEDVLLEARAAEEDVARGVGRAVLQARGRVPADVVRPGVGLDRNDLQGCSRLLWKPRRLCSMPCGSVLSRADGHGPAHLQRGIFVHGLLNSNNIPSYNNFLAVPILTMQT